MKKLSGKLLAGALEKKLLDTDDSEHLHVHMMMMMMSEGTTS